MKKNDYEVSPCFTIPCTHRLSATWLLICLSVVWIPSLSAQNAFWPSAGQNLQNTRFAKTEHSISPENVDRLQVNWAYTTEGDVSATPAVDANYVYFPDFKGMLYKINAASGSVVWSHPLSYYTGVEGDFARVTPALSGNMMVIGTQANRMIPGTMNGAHVMAINKITGKLMWMTKVDDHIGAIITQSPVVYNDRVYVGTSSNEEGLATNDDYPCCSFRGSVLSLDLKTGQILWKTFMVPDGMNFSGGAVWGSTPVVDAKRNSLYVTTGNNYTVPQAILDCVAAGGTADEVRACVMAVPGSSENYFNAIVSLDLTTGAIKWVNTVMPFDAWTVACLFEGENCPDEAGPDYDFGQGPALYTTGSGANKRELLGAGQKSGIYWALNPADGSVVWSTQVGPGGTLGGLEWGSAVDGEQVYVAVANSDYLPHQMTTGPGRGTTVRGGFWASLDARDGDLIWENAAENPPAVMPDEEDGIVNPIARNIGPVSVANGVMFAGAGDSLGTMYAFDAFTGDILWSFASGGSVASGPAIVNGKIYWGSGYTNIGFGTPNNKLYSFHLADNSELPGDDHLTIPQGPMEYLESQNFPNPFEHVTDIVFELPSSDHVTVVIYDQVGNMVKTILDETLGRGFHKVTWDANDMAPGTYLYKLSTSGHSEVKKMVLL